MTSALRYGTATTGILALMAGAQSVLITSPALGTPPPEPMRNRMRPPKDSLTSSDPAREFCAANGLTTYVNVACGLIDDLFVVAAPPTLTKGEDPEFPDEWVTISILAIGDVEKIATAYDEFVRQWVRLAPQPVLGKVRLSLGVA